MLKLCQVICHLQRFLESLLFFRAYAFFYDNYVLRTAGGVLNPACKGSCVSPIFYKRCLGKKM